MEKTWNKYFIFEILALAIIIYGLVISYGSAWLVSVDYGMWPSIGNPKSYQSFLFRDDQDLWSFISGTTELAVVFAFLFVWPYLLLILLRLPYLFYTKKNIRKSYIPIALLVLSTFYISDFFGVLNWLGD